MFGWYQNCFYLCTRFSEVKYSGCSAVRLAHLLWEQGVVGSNPATPTDKNQGVTVKCSSFFILRMGRLNWQLTWIMSTKMSTIKTMNATVNVVCYQWKTLANGEHPLMLRICKDGKRKYQSLGISVNPKYWDFKKNIPKSKCPNLEYIQKIILDKKLEFQERMLEMKADQKDYSAETLVAMREQKTNLKTVGYFYQEIIAQCKADNKCGNRLVYLNSYNSLMRFTKGKLEIPFGIINVAWLEKYEKWLRTNGNKDTTISLMFRTLRSTYNKAIKAKCARKSDYPFDEYKISKFDVTTQKRAIAKTEILKFTKASQPIGQKKYVELSKDIFIFSYLCGGINFTVANT